ncbi:MAG: DUF308 domain-containing protein [Clostridia bacterium]
MEYFEKILKKAGWTSILESVIFAILGAILIWKPEGTIKVISTILGLIFIIIGIARIMAYISTKGKNDFYNNDLIFGIMAIVIGIVTMVCGNTIIEVFRIIIGIWIIYSALIRFSTSLKLRTLKANVWIYSMILAIVMFICGLYITMNSGAVIVTIGIVMVIYSVIDIIENIIFMKNMKDVF